MNGMARRTSVLALGLLLAGSALSQGDGAREKGAEADQSKAAPEALLQRGELFDRICTLGASLSAGFGNSMPISRLLSATLRPKGRVYNGSDASFFMRPLQVGPRLVARVQRRKPTLVIAADFLFWYSYGYMSREHEAKLRPVLLEKGLRELEKFRCPIVIADLPDMRGADTRMLKKVQIPSKATLKLLNEKIREWAKGKKHVLVFPLAELTQRMRAGKLSLEPRHKGGKALVLTAKQALLWDRLHPTRLGAIVFGNELVKALRAWVGKGAKIDERIDYDSWALLEKFDALPKKERNSGEGSEKKGKR